MGRFDLTGVGQEVIRACVDETRGMGYGAIP